MKTFIKLVIIITLLLLLCTTTTDAMSVTLHRCTVFIERATPDELVLELWSTSQVTVYSVDINYGCAPCSPWDGHKTNWVERKELTPGLYILPWIEFYNDEIPELGMEACINWTCQPEITVIYWSQDYQTVLGYSFLPLVRRLR